MELIGHGLAFEPAFREGGVLVYVAEPGAPVARQRAFWTSLCDPEGRLLAHLRFERRLGLSGRALFALAEVRLPPAEEEGERGTPSPFLTPAEFARACRSDLSGLSFVVSSAGEHAKSQCQIQERHARLARLFRERQR